MKRIISSILMLCICLVVFVSFTAPTYAANKNFSMHGYSFNAKIDKKTGKRMAFVHSKAKATYKSDIHIVITLKYKTVTGWKEANHVDKWKQTYNKYGTKMLDTKKAKPPTDWMKKGFKKNKWYQYTINYKVVQKTGKNKGLVERAEQKTKKFKFAN